MLAAMPKVVDELNRWAYSGEDSGEARND